MEADRGGVCAIYRKSTEDQRSEGKPLQNGFQKRKFSHSNIPSRSLPLSVAPCAAPFSQSCFPFSLPGSLSTLPFQLSIKSN